MASLERIKTENYHRVIDFMLLMLTYYLSCLLLAVGSGTALLVQAFIYASVVCVCVRLCGVLLNKIHLAVSKLARQIICNASGILVASILMLIVGRMTPGSSELLVGIAFSSVMAFFVLGTLSPVFHKSTSSA